MKSEFVRQNLTYVKAPEVNTTEAIFHTGDGGKGKQNLYLFTLWFLYKLAFILFVHRP